jgi:hypothetical protein
MCCLHLLLRCFGAPTSRLHRSLLSPCHLVWPGWLPPGCCGPVARLVTVTLWHAALQLQPSSYNFKLMIGKLEVGEWPLSPRGQGWAFVCPHGLCSVSALTRSTWAPHNASGTGNWHIALPKFAGGSMRVQDDDGLSGELPRSVAL